MQTLRILCSSSFDKNNQETEAENDLERNNNATADEKNVSHRKRKKPMNSVFEQWTLAKLFIDNESAERLLKFRAEETESQESTSWKWWNWCLTNCILLLLELRSRVQWASFCMKLICILPYNIATFTKRKYHWVNYLHFTICWLNSSTFGNHWAEAMNNIMWNIIIGWDQKFTSAVGFKPIAMRQKILAYVNFILTPKQGLFIQTAGVMICQTELSQSKKFSQY